ncbi:MAG TPA: T9SS type A sorting domain-containing protein [Bacteroidia bacterium]|nr:T9SS type A sorting domain-containing protein [Bacteroidia bacterium]
MKKIYTLFILMLAVMTASAQLPLQLSSQPGVANLPAKTHTDNRGSGQFYIDYEGWDSYLAGNSQSFVRWVHNNWTTNGDVKWVVQTYDSLWLTPDYSNFAPYEYTNHSVLIDSIFYRIHHQNNSGLDDTLTVSLVELGPGPNYRPTTNVLWSNTTYTAVDLTGHPTTPGSYPTGTFYEVPALTLPAGIRFGIKIEYSGDVTDTFAIIYTYPHDGSTLCNTSTTTYAPVVSSFYPSAFYMAYRTPPTPPTLYPSTNGNGYWYFDCNGSTSPNWPQENPYQDWSIWAFVTIGPLGVEETPKNEINLFQNNPNPFSDRTVIRYQLQKAGNVQIEYTDITGRIISTRNEGFRNAGTYATSFDGSQLSKGVYFFTLKTENGSVTNRMVIAR